MDASGTTDVYRTIEYGRERYWMNRIPAALLGCAVGLFMIATNPEPPGLLPLVVLGALLVVGAALAIARLAMEQAIFNLKPAWAIGFLLALVLALGVAAYFGVLPRHRRTSISSFGPLGWMIVFFSLGFIAYALWKHLHPDRPLMALSPAGLMLDVSWLKGLLIPWHEIERVGQLEHILPGGSISRHPEIAAVTISQDFYEHHILPKRTFMSGKFWSAIFHPRDRREDAPKGTPMQMLLPYPWFSIPLKDIQEPVEARWKFFREQPADAAPQASDAPPLRMSAWSARTTTPWRKVLLAAPTAGILLMLAHFGGLWDTAFLQTAREDAANRRARLEQSRKESQRISDELKRSNEAAEERERSSRESQRKMDKLMIKRF